MAWKMDNPMYCLSDEQEQQDILKKWGEERMGGLIHPSNNRMPLPFVFLIGLIIVTAFLITMPIWGQRPTAELYKVHVELMNTPEVERLATPAEKMKYLDAEAMKRSASHEDPRNKGQLERHPMEWDDLLNLAPQIIELQKQTKYPLNNFTVVGDKIVIANFEGNIRTDGVLKANGDPERNRQQPWWDKGYTIDVFYVSYFLIWMTIMTKRLPHYSIKPQIPAK